MKTASRGVRSRARRKVAAMARDEAAARRTPQQQLARLNAAGHTAARERARLERQIEEGA